MGIKISEISRKSGVAASTIRYYVREGLLPEPERKNRNMSYYDEACIERIKTVRHFQEKKFYPLTVIRNIMRRIDDGMSVSEAEAIEHAVFGDGTETLTSRTEFLIKTGLMEDELKEAEAAGLLMPFMQEGKKRMYDADDIRFGRIIKRMSELGINIRKLDFYVQIGRALMDHEMALRKDVVKGKSKEENIRITSEITKSADTIRGYVLKRLFQRTVENNIRKSLLKNK
ncbi:MAG TPA: MerR family transcriptional regulator [Desulfomonilia bacterium]